MKKQEKPIVINIGKLVENINVTGSDVSNAQADEIATKIRKTMIDAINCISPDTIKEPSKICCPLTTKEFSEKMEKAFVDAIDNFSYDTLKKTTTTKQLIKTTKLLGGVITKEYSTEPKQLYTEHHKRVKFFGITILKSKMIGFTKGEIFYNWI